MIKIKDIPPYISCLSYKDILTLCEGYALASALLYLFYSAVIPSLIPGIGGAIVFFIYMKRNKKEKEKITLMIEFKDAMDSMISALTAGYSMENALDEAIKDLMLMYGSERPIITNLRDISAKVALGRPLDEVFMEFGKKSQIEDIITFSQVYATARKSGGNLIRVMKKTADSIDEKIEIENEVQTMITGKRMESVCMMVIPLLIIVYLRIFSPGYLDPLYEGVIGRIFMTVTLIIYIAAIAWSRRIMNIKMH